MGIYKEFFILLKEQFKLVSWLEGTGVIFGIAEVLFAKFNKVWLYPCGLISIVITSYIFFHNRLYAETLLQLYYFVMTIYGWVLWSSKKNVLAVSFSKNKEWKIALIIVGLAWVVLYLFLFHFTNSDVPFWDSFVSASAWAGMWLLAKRKVENWLFLNLSNLIAIPLLFHKQLILYSLLTIFLFIIAIFGYLDWVSRIKKLKKI